MVEAGSSDFKYEVLSRSSSHIKGKENRKDKQMKNQSVLLAKETEDGYVSLGTITIMPDSSNDTDKIEKKSDGKAEQ